MREYVKKKKEILVCTVGTRVMRFITDLPNISKYNLNLYNRVEFEIYFDVIIAITAECSIVRYAHYLCLCVCVGVIHYVLYSEIP